MTWLTSPPINYWLLGYSMFGLAGLGFMLALYGTGYAQTGFPVWYRRIMGAYFFPTNRLGNWLEKRNVPGWARQLMGVVVWLNLAINLSIGALPVERLITIALQLFD